MKALPKRKGNPSSVKTSGVKTSLNESPSQKEGKFKAPKAFVKITLKPQ